MMWYYAWNGQAGTKPASNLQDYLEEVLALRRDAICLGKALTDEVCGGLDGDVHGRCPGILGPSH